MTTNQANNPVFSSRSQPSSASRPEGVARALQALVQDLKPQRVLDTGCGTGYWLNKVQPFVPFACGIDLSLNMLACVDRSGDRPALVCGNAGRRLPFQEAAFDLIICVNALPNFGPAEAFLAESRRLLRPGGALAIIGTTPHEQRESSYLYQSFGGVFRAEAHKFPSWGTLTDALVAGGFDTVDWRMVERIATPRVGMLTGRIAA